MNNNCSAYINDSVSTPLSDYAHFFNCDIDMPIPVASKLQMASDIRYDWKCDGTSDRSTLFKSNPN